MEALTTNEGTRENRQLEFKKAKGGLPSSFFETYSSFSNTKGGTIYLGLEELKDRTVVSAMLGEDDIAKLKTDLFSLMNDPKKVSVNLIAEDEVREVEYEGYPVLMVAVRPAPRELRPVYINNNIMTGSFRRNADGDYHCTPGEIKAMLRDAEEKSQDLCVLQDIGLDVLCEESIASYKSRFRSLHPEHVFLNKGDVPFLEFLGAIRLGDDGIYHPTVAGLLMFGYAHKIVYEFPEYFLDYQEHYSEDENVRWTDRVTSDSGDWSGCLFDFYNRIVNKMTSDLKVPFRMEGIERIDESALHKALREALCNAISNADFHQRRGLVVKKYFDRVEFHNPGCLRMSAEQAFEGGDSDARNKTVLKMWSLVGVGERAGSGVPMILSACEEFGFVAPELYDEYNPDRTHLIIRFSVKGKADSVEISDAKPDTKYGNKEKKILSFLLNNGQCKAKDIASSLGFGLSTTKTILYRLVDAGLISSAGTVKNKRYFLAK